MCRWWDLHILEGEYDLVVAVVVEIEIVMMCLHSFRLLGKMSSAVKKAGWTGNLFHSTWKSDGVAISYFHSYILLQIEEGKGDFHFSLAIVSVRGIINEVQKLRLCQHSFRDRSEEMKHVFDPAVQGRIPQTYLRLFCVKHQ